MSKSIVIASAIGVIVLGGLTASGVAFALGGSDGPAEPTVENVSARYTAPAEGVDGALTLTAKVSDGSGVRSLKVLPWPKSSDLDPKAGELAQAERATCEKSSDHTSTCTYTLKVTPREESGLEKGTWYVSALATGKDGGKTFIPKAATFQVPR